MKIPLLVNMRCNDHSVQMVCHLSCRPAKLRQLADVLEHFSVSVRFQFVQREAILKQTLQLIVDEFAVCWLPESSVILVMMSGGFVELKGGEFRRNPSAVKIEVDDGHSWCVLACFRCTRSMWWPRSFLQERMKMTSIFFFKKKSSNRHWVFVVHSCTSLSLLHMRHWGRNSRIVFVVSTFFFFKTQTHITPIFLHHTKYARTCTDMNARVRI